MHESYLELVRRRQTLRRCAWALLLLTALGCLVMPHQELTTTRAFWKTTTMLLIASHCYLVSSPVPHKRLLFLRTLVLILAAFALLEWLVQ